MARHRRHKSSSMKKRDEGKGFREYYKKYSTPEQRAGHRYNISKKHREAESRGMKRHNDDMHERADDETQLYHKGRGYYGMGYGEPSNLPQEVVRHDYPEPYSRLCTDYPDTIEEIDEDMMDNFRKAEAYPSDSMY